MYLITKQQILSTVQGLPETIELNELISLLTTMDLKTATTSQPEVTETSLSEAAKKYAGSSNPNVIMQMLKEGIFTIPLHT